MGEERFPGRDSEEAARIASATTAVAKTADLEQPYADSNYAAANASLRALHQARQKRTKDKVQRFRLCLGDGEQGDAVCVTVCEKVGAEIGSQLWLEGAVALVEVALLCEAGGEVERKRHDFFAASGRGDAEAVTRRMEHGAKSCVDQSSQHSAEHEWTVLEVGSGIGFAGIAFGESLAAAFQCLRDDADLDGALAQSVLGDGEAPHNTLRSINTVLTEQEKILPFLEKNLQLNFFGSSSVPAKNGASSTHRAKTSYHIAPLDWFSPDDHLESLHVALARGPTGSTTRASAPPATHPPRRVVEHATVLGSECVYDPRLVLPLLRCLCTASRALLAERAAAGAVSPRGSTSSGQPGPQDDHGVAIYLSVGRARPEAESDLFRELCTTQEWPPSGDTTLRLELVNVFVPDAQRSRRLPAAAAGTAAAKEDPAHCVDLELDTHRWSRIDVSQQVTKRTFAEPIVRASRIAYPYVLQLRAYSTN